ncbi:unnamed protein product, partial [Mesorhabditis spiculigera]
MSYLPGCRARLLHTLIRRHFASGSKGKEPPPRPDTGVLGGYHHTPLGDSDMPQRTRVSYLSTEMREAKMTGVRGLSCLGFRMIDGSFLYGPVALFPKTALSWRVLTPTEITPESLSLFACLEPKIDVLVIGAGDKKNVDMVRKQVAGFLREHKIGLEIMDTEDAIATFNFLNAEGRCVAAALYPPDDMIVTDAEYGRALNLLRSADTLDENPLTLGIFDVTGSDEDLVKKLWGPTASWEEVKEKVLRIGEMKEQRQLEDGSKKND